MALASALPAPKFSTTIEEVRTDEPVKTVQDFKPSAPPYGQRKGWFPKDQSDFGDGGAYPEVHRAQYPLELGRKKTNGNTLALQVDGEGNVRWDAIAKQGQRDGKHVQANFKDLVPLAHRTDSAASERQAMERPSEEEVNATAARTKAALEQLSSSKIKAAQPKALQVEKGKENYVRYTPATTGQQRIIKMTEVTQDPLEPSKFKGKKIPPRPPSPPPPVMKSPPRKITAQDQKDWMIPPCVSNWKNHKGYTIPLDKRLAADGRGLQETLLNDRFASFSEALYIADRHARDEVKQRAQLQQRIAEKEKAEKEENLRAMAQRAREERAGITSASSKPKVAASSTEGGGAMAAAMAAYGSDSEDEVSPSSSPKQKQQQQSGSEGGDVTPKGGDRRRARRGSSASASASASATSDKEDQDEDDEGARERERQRREKRRERERELRMSNMGTEQRARVLARAQNRDISEKVALGLAKPTTSKESMLDSRLFNREQLQGSFGDDDSYNMYDRPLFQGSSAAAAIYKAPGAGGDASGNEEAFGGGTEEGVRQAMSNDRFGLGVAKGFEGAELQESRDGPVQFEKDTSTNDPFGVDAFMGSVNKGVKRDNKETDNARNKRMREDDD